MSATVQSSETDDALVARGVTCKFYTDLETVMHLTGKKNLLEFQRVFIMITRPGYVFEVDLDTSAEITGEVRGALSTPNSIEEFMLKTVVPRLDYVIQQCENERNKVAYRIDQTERHLKNHERYLDLAEKSQCHDVAVVIKQQIDEFKDRLLKHQIFAGFITREIHKTEFHRDFIHNSFVIKLPMGQLKICLDYETFKLLRVIAGEPKKKQASIVERVFGAQQLLFASLIFEMWAITRVPALVYTGMFNFEPLGYYYNMKKLNNQSYHLAVMFTVFEEYSWPMVLEHFPEDTKVENDYLFPDSMHKEAPYHHLFVLRFSEQLVRPSYRPRNGAKTYLLILWGQK